MEHQMIRDYKLPFLLPNVIESASRLIKKIKLKKLFIEII